MGELIFVTVLTAFFLFLGLVGGTYFERLHLRDLEEREAANGDILITQLRTFPLSDGGGQPPMLLVGEAVIASDYLKTFLSGLRKIFGGELRSYQSMLVRARREALQRIVEQARERGYDAICNVRYISADVGGNASQRRMPMASILASATAYCRAKPMS